MDKNSATVWVSQLFDAIDGNDWSALVDMVSEDVCYERPGYDALQGKSAFMHFYEQVRMISSGKHTVNHVFVDGHHIIYSGSFQGQLRDGTSCQVEFCDVCQLDGDLLKHRKTFFYVPAV